MDLGVDTLDEARSGASTPLRTHELVKAPIANQSEYANDIVRPHAGYSNNGGMQLQGQCQGQGHGPLASTTE